MKSDDYPKYIVKLDGGPLRGFAGGPDGVIYKNVHLREYQIEYAIIDDNFYSLRDAFGELERKGFRHFSPESMEDYKTKRFRYNKIVGDCDDMDKPEVFTYSEEEFINEFITDLF